MELSLPARKVWEERVLHFLFLIQIPGAFLVGGSRLISILAGKSLEGVIVAEFISFAAFALISASLAKGDAKLRSVYLLWFGISLSHIAAVLFRGGYTWNPLDTGTVVGVTIMIGATLAIGYSKGLGPLDPIVKGWVAVAFKALPQFMLALHIAGNGTDGLGIVPVISGHLTILLRIGQVGFLIHRYGRDRAKTGILIAETWNELSWLAVGIVWFMK